MSYYKFIFVIAFVVSSLSAQSVCDSLQLYDQIGELNTPEKALALTVGDFDGDGSPDMAVIQRGSNSLSSLITVYLNDGDGEYVEAGTYQPDGGKAQDIRATDFDGDGDIDLVYLATDFTRLFTLYNDGSGVFNINPFVIYPGVDAQHMEVADMDDDGDPDTVLTNLDSSGGVLIVFNEGASSFSSILLDTERSAEGLDIMDLDGDGDLDIVASHRAASLAIIDMVSVLINLGNGTFAEVVEYQIGNDAYDVSLGDLDGDGYADMGVVSRDTLGLSILMNNGDATFTSPQKYETISSPLNVQMDDMDGDGDLDIVVGGNQYPPDPGFHLNNGDGSFAPFYKPVATESAFDIALVDVDSDNDVDMLVAGWSNNSVYICLNRGDATFEPEFRSLTGKEPTVLELEDFNNDGILDLVCANTSDNTVSVMIGLENGLFQDQSVYPTGTRPSGIATGDIDGDGDKDFVVTNYTSNNMSVYLNDGIGGFVLGDIVAGFRDPVAVAICDLDSDGRLDIAIASEYSSGSGLVILIGNNNGTFLNPETYRVEDDPAGIAVGDINADGIPDVVVSNSRDDNFSVYDGLGDGTFGNYRIFATGDRPTDVHLADMDNDEDLDIVSASTSDGQVCVLLNRGNGEFVFKGRFELGYFSLNTIDVGDMNHDGYLDIATATYTNKFVLFINRGDATFEEPLVIRGGQRIVDVRLGDMDNDGDLDLVGTNSFYDGAVVIKNECNPPQCAPDLTDDTTLDFFDVSAFLTAFSNQEPAADFTGDGNFDFFDVSAFLTAFAQGCP